MPTRDYFENPAELEKYLAKQLLEGRLAVALGAGTSVAFGLPNWSQLLKRLYEARRSRCPMGIDLKKQAEDFRLKYYKDDHPGFLAAVKKALYKSAKTDFLAMRKNTTIAAVASLAMASLRGSITEIVSLNWDDLLETYLEYHGFVTASIIEETNWAEKVDAAILHPHGFIPHDPHRQASKTLIFDQLSYSRVVGHVTNPWRQRILSLMRTHTFLFIGISGSDENLDSMLVTAKEEHASRAEGTPFWGVTFSKSGTKTDMERWEERGIFFQVVKDYSIDLPNFLFRICQKAARLRRP